MILTVPVLAFGLYKRFARVASFQGAELQRSARFARARVGLAISSALLLVVIAVVGAAGAPVTVVYALLFILIGVVLAYLGVTIAAGVKESMKQRGGDSITEHRGDGAA